MLIRLHGNATATPAKRAYIYQNRHRPTAELQRELVLEPIKGEALVSEASRAQRNGQNWRVPASNWSVNGN